MIGVIFLKKKNYRKSRIVAMLFAVVFIFGFTLTVSAADVVTLGFADSVSNKTITVSTTDMTGQSNATVLEIHKVKYDDPSDYLYDNNIFYVAWNGTDGFTVGGAAKDLVTVEGNLTGTALSDLKITFPTGDYYVGVYKSMTTITAEAPPSVTSGVVGVYNVISNVVINFAKTVSENPLIALFAIGLPVISFGAGLLLRIKERT